MGSKATRQPLLHLLFIALSLLFVVPFLLIVSVSLSNDQDIADFGYRLIPARIDLSAYTWVFRDLSTVLRAYGVTAFQAVAGTTLGVLAMALAGYVLSRTDYAWRRIVVFVIFFTLVFSGGLVPTYIIVTRWYHLGNTLWVYIFPVLVNAFFVIIIRTFFTQLPEEVFESARIDGAREITICLRVALPMSTPALAAIAFLFFQGRWDEWYNTLLYIRDKELYTLQYLLQRILLEFDYVREIAAQSPEMEFYLQTEEMPLESMRYAMAIVAAGPILLIFPFFQRYFVRGLTVGSLKG